MKSLHQILLIMLLLSTANCTEPPTEASRRGHIMPVELIDDDDGGTAAKILTDCKDYVNMFHELDDNNLAKPTKFPVNVVVNPNVSITTMEQMIAAVETWNAKINYETFFITISTSTELHGLCNWVAADDQGMLPPGAVGVTYYQSCTADSIVIEDSVLTTNGIYQAMVHELGHVLTLQHEDDPLSIMYPTIGNPAQHISEKSYCIAAQLVLSTFQ